MLTLFRMALFRAVDKFGGGGVWGGQKGPHPNISHTYPTIMKLGTVISCLEKTRKIYESLNALLEFC